MSHRKVHSLGNVPFSWEDKPGVSKVTHHECPADMGLTALFLPPQPSSSSTCDHSDSPSTMIHDRKIPPPPCQFQPPRRSTSLKGLWWQDDPFVAAFKECTKNNNSVRYSKVLGESKNGIVSKARKSKCSIFSCKKDSCDVEDVNLVRLSNLPPLPKERHRGLSKMRKY